MIEVRDLRMVYPNGYEALQNVSLNIDDGEFVCIIGRSGAGKSTLLRCLNGLLSATSGYINVANVDVMSSSEKERRKLRTRVGFVFQEYNLVDRLSVINNVLCGRLGNTSAWRCLLRAFKEEDRIIALSALERVRLLHRAQQRSDSLSGGEKQRVALARALAQEPVVLLADEPVASLDPELAIEVMRDIHRVAKEIGVPTLVNIHDINLARMFADRVIGIAQGVVEYDGPISELDSEALNRIYRFDKESAPGEREMEIPEDLEPGLKKEAERGDPVPVSAD